MRIVSKFHDYYDITLGTTGVDTSLVYARTPANIDLNLPFMSRVYVDYETGVKYKGNEVVGISPMLVGFCGKTFKGATVSTRSKSPVRDNAYFVWKDEALSIMEKCYARFNSKWRKIFLGGRYLKFKEFSTYTFPENLYHEHSTPIIMYRQLLRSYKEVQKNTRLEDVQFYKCVDAFTAFQEIQMFLGGTLSVNKKPPVEVSDKVRIEAHGFDSKWSFRKHRDDPPIKRNKKR